MLTSLLPVRARWALGLLLLIGLIVRYVPSASSGADTTSYPLGVDSTRTDTEVTVRTGDGQEKTVTVDGGESRHCTGGTTFPSCLSH